MAMDAKGLDLDYFLFYDVRPRRIETRVELRCQFDEEPEVAEVAWRERFGDRIMKNNQDLYDVDASLTWYRLFDPEPDPLRQVIIEDQFGDNELIVGRLEGLLVPAVCGNVARKFPEKLDHYKVYRCAKSRRPADVDVALEGEFFDYTVHLADVAYFAVPCSKSHNGKDYEIKNSQAHLVIYGLEPHGEGLRLRARDQFGRFRTELEPPELLAAPCDKKDWREF